MSNLNDKVKETCTQCQKYVVREGSEFGIKYTECGEACCIPCIIEWASSGLPQEQKECPTCARVGHRSVVPADYFKDVDAKLKSPTLRQKKKSMKKVENNVKLLPRWENSMRRFSEATSTSKSKNQGSGPVSDRSSSNTLAEKISTSVLARASGASKVPFRQNVSDRPRHPVFHRRKQQPGDLMDDYLPNFYSAGYERMQYENNTEHDSPPSPASSFSSFHDSPP